MPGKYSHSVVLADYSSRGIISLPPDQVSKYQEYVNSTPLAHKTSISQLRLRGTRSAQAVYRDVASNSPGRHQSPNQVHSNIGGQSPQTKERLKIVPDEDGANTFQPMRYSRYYEKMPQSTPVLALGTQSSQPEMRTAYQRQQQIDANLKSLPPVPRLVSQDRQNYVSNEQRPSDAPARNRNANASSNRGVENVGRASNFAQPQTVGGSRSTTNGASPALASLESQSHEKRSRVQAPVKSVSVTATSHSENRFKGVSAPNGSRSYASSNSPVSPEPSHNPSMSSTRHDPQRTDSYASKHTQIWNPKSTVDSEPNFDGFSDVEAKPSDYFDMYRPPIIHSRSSSLNSTLPIQRPGSSDRPASRGQQSITTPVLNKVVPLRNGDRDSPSRTTGSSIQTPTQTQRTDSSVSSISITNALAHSSVVKPSIESPRRTHQSWHLPEIKEDHGFSPSIFEDTEGQNAYERREEIESALSTLTIGQISSGKDVKFDNSDAASELSAALPPPITRFRDEEDEFNANMARLFGEGGDSAITKKGSHSMGRSATKKTKGFFSKFRSKTHAPDK